MPAPKPLTVREQAFVKHYCTNGFQGKAAAIAAQYSPKTAAVAASKLIRKPAVVKAVETAQLAALRRIGVDAAWLLKELLKQYEDAETDVRPIIDPVTRKQMRVNGSPAFQKDRRAIIQLLKLLGDHVEVQGFRENIAVDDGTETVKHLMEARVRLNTRKE